VKEEGGSSEEEGGSSEEEGGSSLKSFPPCYSQSPNLISPHPP
jgi:hypothetical protein